MSKIHDFFEKVGENQELQTKLIKIISDAEQAGETEIGTKIIDFASEAGFDITIDELREYFKEMAGSEDGSLSDSELNMISGGSFIDFFQHFQSTLSRYKIHL
jgi:predicted ribosomally synthesized peptide with nif11-like leader